MCGSLLVTYTFASLSAFQLTELSVLVSFNSSPYGRHAFLS